MRPIHALLMFAAPVTHAALLSPVWIELGDGGRAVARVVVSSAADCPNVQIGGTMHPMSPRKPVPAGFRPACEFVIPANTGAATVSGKPLPLARPDPSRIVVLGDTGCRIKGTQLQDCDDPEKWPFARIARSAAGSRPELVIHVGDYLYREEGGPPSGDTWDAWNADFFKPAAELLASAPWVFVRGNHESCERSWRGWFYYLDPRPFTGACVVSSPPYSVTLGRFQAINFDSAAVNENQAVPQQVALYASQLASLRAANAWLVAHHPFWAVRAGTPDYLPVAQTITLQQAWDRASPKGIDIVLSGHTHLFEVLSYGSSRPLRVVAGDGGTNLANPVPSRVNGMDVHGVMVAESETRRAFGYTLFTKRGLSWEMRLTDSKERALVSCRIVWREAKCSGQVVTVDSAKHP